MTPPGDGGEGQGGTLFLPGPFELESGDVLPGISLAWRSWGRLSPGGDNATVICHALTGSADAAHWWPQLFSAPGVFDLDQDFVVCSNVLGGCYGSSGPLSPAPDGRPWGARFPRITLRDQVRAQIALADALGIRRIRCVLGGSMGGAQALEWALLDPLRVGAIAVIAAAGRQSAWCLAWSEAQRLALEADPRFRGGDYPVEDPPSAGLAAARAVAMISYRAPASLDQRFDRATGAEVFGSRALQPDDYAVRGWLRHHGAALVERFDANSYRVLLDALDTHDLSRGRGDYAEVLRSIHQPVLVVSIRSDGLYLPDQQRSLHALLPNSIFHEIDSAHGHDGFLIDAERFTGGLGRFLAARRARYPHGRGDPALAAVQSRRVAPRAR